MQAVAVYHCKSPVDIDPAKTTQSNLNPNSVTQFCKCYATF